MSVTQTAPGMDKAQGRALTSANCGDQPGAYSAAVDPIINADVSPARIIASPPSRALSPPFDMLRACPCEGRG